MKWAGFRSQVGSGSLLAVGIVAVILVTLTMFIPLYVGLTARQSVEHAADASALAGADVAAGISPGSPCDVAAELATANRAKLDACREDGLIVTVRVTRGYLGLDLTSTATAGPPSVVTN